MIADGIPAIHPILVELISSSEAMGFHVALCLVASIYSLFYGVFKRLFLVQ